MKWTAEQIGQLPVWASADVLVVGGGVAGIAAALAAARSGARTILMEREYMVGGLATAGLVTIYLPLCDGCGRQVSFGIAEELLRRSIALSVEADFPDAWLGNADPEGRRQQRFMVRYNAQECALLWERALREAGVTLLYGVQITDAVVEDGAIRQIVAQGRADRGRILASAYVDATGDAVLAAAAGEEICLFRQGNILAGWYYGLDAEGLRFHMLGACDVPDDQKTDQNKPQYLSRRRFGGLDSLEMSELTLSSHDVTFNHILKEKEVHPEAVPVTLATIPQIRMTRRIVGAAVLDDKAPHTHQPDSIGMVSDWRKRGPVYELPLGILHGNRVANLYAAGRCVSVTDSMWDITRVIPDCAVTGQAAGHAAALCAKYGRAPSAEEVQSLLRRHGVALHESEL